MQLYPSSTGTSSGTVRRETYLRHGASLSSDSEVCQQVNIVKLLHPVSTLNGNRNHLNTGDPVALARLFFRKVAYSRYDVPSQMSDNIASSCGMQLQLY
jgi:hypothetical protein